MLTGTLPLQLYKACQEHAPLVIAPVSTRDKLWQTHSNYFSVLWIQEGTGRMETDFSHTKYAAHHAYCYNNYQSFALHPDEPTEALLLLFHPNFFCIETYQHEVGCNGVLFNQVFDPASIRINPGEAEELLDLIGRMQQETMLNGMAMGELLFSYLKILLVKLTRLKTAQVPGCDAPQGWPATLDKLIALINEHFTTRHEPSFYAERLNLSPKSLGNLVRRYCKKSLSALIREKLLLRAKWELLHTDHQVKLIAAHLGFEDEYYFSRFFKKHIGVSPKHFREAEWEMRRGFLSIP